MTATAFTVREIAYLTTQPIGRLATVGAHGQPHNVPVGVHYNAELDTIDIGGMNLPASRKYRDVLVNERVSFVVDDVVSTDPWEARGIEIRGRASVCGGGRRLHFPGDELIRVSPLRIISWGIEDHWSAGFHARDVTAHVGATAHGKDENDG
ncbi:PPOX class F420-dependent oxidoreductase [Actinoplanes sp. NPDC004185]